MSVEKLVVDGKVAVVYAANFGSGWSSCVPSEYAEIFLFHPMIAQAVLDGCHEDIPSMRVALGLPHNCYQLAWAQRAGLGVAWLLVGTRFRVDEYDGAESIITVASLDRVA